MVSMEKNSVTHFEIHRIVSKPAHGNKEDDVHSWCHNQSETTTLTYTGGH